MWFRALIALCGLAVAFPAHALDPFMWGVGPRIGTMVIPGRYPITFPKAVADRFEDDEGNPIPAEEGGSTLEKVLHDITIGAEGVYYLDSYHRVVSDLGVGFGKRFYDLHVLFKYNYVARAGAMDFLFGGGAGFGYQRFRGDADERLSISYFPLRGEVAALVRDDTRGYQGTVFLLYNLPQNTRYVLTTGDDVDVGWGFYLTFGIELSVQFGDFTPPRRR